MWRERTNIMPVTTGALGTITKGFDENVQLLPGQSSTTEL